MQYLGGKYLQAARIVERIIALTPLRAVVEPFCGGASVSAAFAAKGCSLVLSDAHPALVAMWRAAIFDGWRAPEVVSEDEYRDAKRLLPDTDPRKAAIGFGSSFGAKYFGGYARSKSGQDYSGNAARGIERKAAQLRGAVTSISCASFVEIPIPADPVVLYCDPPYAGTLGYVTGLFDSEAFWSRCREWAGAGHAVFVSEYAAPTGWLSVLDLPRAQTLPSEVGAGALTDQKRIERLFCPERLL